MSHGARGKRNCSGGERKSMMCNTPGSLADAEVSETVKERSIYVIFLLLVSDDVSDLDGSKLEIWGDSCPLN